METNKARTLFILAISIEPCADQHFGIQLIPDIKKERDSLLTVGTRTIWISNILLGLSLHYCLSNSLSVSSLYISGKLYITANSFPLFLQVFQT